MWSQEIDAASSQRRATLLNDFVRFLLVKRVRKRVSSEGRVFRYRRWKVRSVGRNTARKNELLDAIICGSIYFGDGFHDPGGSGHVDLPHVLNVQYPGTYRIDDEGKVHHRVGMGIAQQFVQSPG